MTVSYGDTIHYNDWGWPACGINSRDNLTWVPRKVTCKGCKRTRAYKEMMED